MKGILFIKPLPKKNPARGKWGNTYNPREEYINTMRRGVRSLLGIIDGEELIEGYIIPFEQAVPICLDVDFIMPRPEYMKKGKWKKEEGLVYHTIKQNDIDNLLKPFQDSFNGLIWHDDSQVCVVRARKFYSELKGEPRIEFKVTRLSVKGTVSCAATWGNSGDVFWREVDKQKTED